MATFGKTGVLIVNLGTPDEPTWSAVSRYLKEFLTDRRVIDYPWLLRNFLVRGIIAPTRSVRVAKDYAELWTANGSPLKHYGEQVAAGVQELLGDDFSVELAMRYQNPSIESAIHRLLDQQVADIIVFPLFPQYASATTGSVHDEVMRVLRKEETIPNVRMINSYYDYQPMIDIYADNARQLDIDSYDHILFSYHGLPERYLKKADKCNHCLQKADCCATIGLVNQFCYSAQCHATTRAIAKTLNIAPDRYTTTFQSRLGPETWARPYTIKVIEERAELGDKRLLVFSPAFVADCLETTMEIADEYQEEFVELGGEQIALVPSLNDDSRWIRIVADLVRKEAIGSAAPVA
jgi:protoporphyrin/coproporphyrin ferrochelatase